MESISNEDLEANNIPTDRQVPTDHLQPERSDNPEPSSSFSNQEFTKWLQLSTTLLLTFFLLILWQQSLFTLEICLIPTIISDLYSISISLLLLRTNRESYEKRLILKDLLENIGTILTKILMMFYLIFKSFQLSFTLIPLVIFTFANLLIKSVSFNKCQIFSEIMFILMRFVRLLTVLSVFFRIDGIFSFDWSLTFWPVWSYVSIVTIIVLGVLLFSVGLYTSQCPGRKIKILGSVYLIVSLTGSSISFTLLFISLSEGSPNFYPPLFFLVIFVTVSHALKRVLQLSLVKFLTDDSEDNNQVLPLPQNSTQYKSRFISAFHSPPKFLQKLSSSYFKEIPVATRQAKKRTSSVMMYSNERVFHHRSMTSEELFRKIQKNAVRAPNEPENKLESIQAEKCMTCMDRYSNAVIMSCGHGGICYECGIKMEEEVGHCHICRGKIELVARVLQYPDGLHEVITESG